jgi:hypothetical protein
MCVNYCARGVAGILMRRGVLVLKLSLRSLLLEFLINLQVGRESVN